VVVESCNEGEVLGNSVALAVCATTVIGLSTINALVSSRAVLAAPSVSNVTMASDPSGWLFVVGLLVDVFFFLVATVFVTF